MNTDTATMAAEQVSAAPPALEFERTIVAPVRRLATMVLDSTLPDGTKRRILTQLLMVDASAVHVSSLNMPSGRYFMREETKSPASIVARAMYCTVQDEVTLAEHKELPHEDIVNILMTEEGVTGTTGTTGATDTTGVGRGVVGDSMAGRNVVYELFGCSSQGKVPEDLPGNIQHKVWDVLNGKQQRRKNSRYHDIATVALELVLEVGKFTPTAQVLDDARQTSQDIGRSFSFMSGTLMQIVRLVTGAFEPSLGAPPGLLPSAQVESTPVSALTQILREMMR